MIDKNVVKSIVEEWLQDKEYFLTDLTISPDNCIAVEIDHKDGVWIDDCVALSRLIESRLNREEEDFELEVGSAGIGQPFKVLQQYINHIGDEVEVLSTGGEKFKGQLTAADEEGFNVTAQVKRTLEGKKRPQLVPEDRRLTYAEVKSVKYVINFK